MTVSGYGRLTEDPLCSNDILANGRSRPNEVMNIQSVANTSIIVSQMLMYYLDA